MLKSVVGIVIVAAVATLGDFVWYEFGVRNRMIAGVAHGAILLMAAGGVVGWTGRKISTGLLLGIGAGVVGALAYYALAPVVRQGAMLAAWATVWILLAIGHGRLIETPQRKWGAIVTSGLAAAVLSGLTFYAVSGIVWGRAPAGGRNYAVQFACWLVAWAPGLLAISGRIAIKR